jgi:hypothetical protein
MTKAALGVLDQWEVFLDVTSFLGVESILAEHVPPPQRYLLDQWRCALCALGEQMEIMRDRDFADFGDDDE